MLTRIALVVSLALALVAWAGFAPRCQAAELLVIGDLQLKPVLDTFSGIQKTCRGSVKSYSPAEVQGRLAAVYEKEGAKVVIALGMNALHKALSLPPSIPVVYGLVVTPPVTSRANTSGFYIATPVSEYAELVKKIGAIARIAVVGSGEQLHWLARESTEKVSVVNVKNSLEFITAIKQLSGASSLLLLPDVSLLTTTAMEEAYTLSFRRRIPILGISERHVKQGALLALVFEPVSVGRQIGEQAARLLKKGGGGQTQPAPPRKFELYINLDTAKKMGIHLPDELVNSAKRLYP